MKILSTILHECNFFDLFTSADRHQRFNGIVYNAVSRDDGVSYIVHNNPYFYTLSLEYFHNRLSAFIVLDNIQNVPLYFVNYIKKELHLIDSKVVCSFDEIDTPEVLFNLGIVLSSYKAYDFIDKPKSFSTDYINLRLLPEVSTKGLSELKADIQQIKKKYDNY